MNKYYKYWSTEYDYHSKEMKIYISMDGKNWIVVETISEYPNDEIADEEVEYRLYELSYEWEK